MYLHRLIQQASLKTAATETIVPQSHARKNLARAALRAVGIFAWSWTLLSLCAYLFLCPAINTPLLDRLATCPCKEESWVAGHDFVGVRCLQLTFPVKAGAKTYKLSGAFYKHPGARDVILISHGNGGSLKYVHRMPQIAYLLSDAHSVFVYDYEGYGISEGNASYRSLARDGLAAFDYANKILGYGQKQILLYGLSMGTGVS